MGMAILVIIGSVAACGAFAFMMLTRSGRQHPRHVRGVRGYDAAQSGVLWGGGDSGSWSSAHSGGDACNHERERRECDEGSPAGPTNQL